MQGEIFTTNRNTFSALAVGPLARWSPVEVAPCAGGSGFLGATRCRSPADAGAGGSGRCRVQPLGRWLSLCPAVLSRVALAQGSSRLAVQSKPWKNRVGSTVWSVWDLKSLLKNRSRSFNQKRNLPCLVILTQLIVCIFSYHCVI